MGEVYAELVDELGDPEQISREFDESVILWHAARLPKRAARDGWTTEEVDALQRAAREEAASYVRPVD